MFKSQPPIPVSVTLFGNRICVDIIKLRWGCTVLERALNLITKYPYQRRGNTETEIDRHTKSQPCKDRDRGCSGAVTTRGSQEPWEPRQQSGEILTRAFRGNMALLIPWCWISSPPKCERVNPCGFSTYFVVTYYSSLQKLLHRFPLALSTWNSPQGYLLPEKLPSPSEWYKQERMCEKTPNMDTMVFFHLILEMVPHHCCCFTI